MFLRAATIGYIQVFDPKAQSESSAKTYFSCNVWKYNGQNKSRSLLICERVGELSVKALVFKSKKQEKKVNINNLITEA